MNKALVIILILLLTGCKSPNKYFNVTDFNMQPNALKDNEPIKLIYTSQGSGNNNERDHYIQVIAVSQNSGDTVNILTPFLHGFTIEDGDKTFNYISPTNVAYNILMLDESSMKDLKHIDSIKITEQKIITKVVRDPKYDNAARNNFPTLIGAIGTVSE